MRAPHATLVFIGISFWVMLKVDAEKFKGKSLLVKLRSGARMIARRDGWRGPELHVRGLAAARAEVDR